MRKRFAYLLALSACLLALIHGAPAQTNTTPAPVVLHAARLLDIETVALLCRDADGCCVDDKEKREKPFMHAVVSCAPVQSYLGSHENDADPR